MIIALAVEDIIRSNIIYEIKIEKSEKEII